MRRVFFDASAYIALTDSSDQFHERAVELVRSARRLSSLFRYHGCESFVQRHDAPLGLVAPLELHPALLQ